ncbi:MAG: hypothetical protein HQK75_07800 [Candidatus Magnetomorum sp.]|nr:hypothetical protein [Candidatus Magnetomorum sp.]
MDKNQIKGRFFFDPKDPIYHYHFPYFPVVPGSLIIGAFLQAIEKDRELKRPVIHTFKFMGFTVPGACDYVIEMTDFQGKCQLFQQEKKRAKGVITYAT